MLAKSEHRTLTRRDSKLLVEVVIGVIGLLGILLAQASHFSHPQDSQSMGVKNSVVISQSQPTLEFDWIDLLF